ncbi:uncharacterized protein LOC116853957 isoform X2 [Odontomachus brunneus]|uniref:uncharacterized protein LOC116853957 isoform X2 n=1 Tax=Odontomachus brunneus TaxID=486640 RepID=UPI0013F1FAAB|nr:uncharacterized protein LOC116853957 isoform X2 [Odontomachus brunneus]
MSLFHGYNEIKPTDLVAKSMLSPCKTTVFKPKDSGQKPKGLSIRSRSDMNVFHSTHPTNVKKNTYTKNLKIQKSNEIRPDSSRHQFLTYSPKEHWKYSNCEYQITEFERLTLKEEKKGIDKDTKTEETLDDKIFKKPLPKRFAKKVHEPENLAHHYDFQHKFDYEHIENIEQEFMDQFLKEKETVILHEEDSAMLVPIEFPELIFPSFFDEEYIKLSSPEISYISDDDTL